MALTITSALAVAFDLAAETFTYTLTGGGGARTVTIALVTDARVLLAASGKDVLQVLQTAMNAVSAMGVTFAVSMGATGLVSITCTGDTFVTNLDGSAIGAILGFTSPIVNPVAAITAQSQPKYIAYLLSRASGDWSQKVPTVAAETISGASWGFTSGVITYTDEFTFEFIPRDTDAVTSTGQNGTPWEPAAANLGSLGSHAVPWGIADVLSVALAKSFGFARGNFQTVRASTSTRFDIVSLAGEDIMAPRAKYQVAGWEAYKTWTVRMTRQSTPTGTRA